MLDDFAALEAEQVEECPVVFALYHMAVDHDEIPLPQQVMHLDVFGDLTALHNLFEVLTVRRQGFWDRWLPELREGLAHLVGLIMRRICGEASVAFRWSFV